MGLSIFGFIPDHLVLRRPAAGSVSQIVTHRRRRAAPAASVPRAAQDRSLRRQTQSEQPGAANQNPRCGPRRSSPHAAATAEMSTNTRYKPRGGATRAIRAGPGTPARVQAARSSAMLAILRRSRPNPRGAPRLRARPARRASAACASNVRPRGESYRPRMPVSLFFCPICGH
jgi:hypothetical protein